MNRSLKIWCRLNALTATHNVIAENTNQEWQKISMPKTGVETKESDLYTMVRTRKEQIKTLIFRRNEAI